MYIYIYAIIYLPIYSYTMCDDHYPDPEEGMLVQSLR